MGSSLVVILLMVREAARLSRQAAQRMKVIQICMVDDVVVMVLIELIEIAKVCRNVGRERGR
jgi:hypothetical protein